MKILYIHQYFKFPNESGGTRSYDLARKFIEYGFQVEVITSTNQVFKSKSKWINIEKDKISVHYISIPFDNNLSNLKRIIFFLKFLYYSTFKALKLSSDIVLATSTPLTIGIPALVKKIINKTPYIFEVRDVWPEAVIAMGAIKNRLIIKVLLLLEKIIYYKASIIVPLSKDMQQSIVGRYPLLAEKCNVIVENISEINRFQFGYNPNISLIQEKIGFQPRFSILYAGTFGKVNGIDYVIKLAIKTILLDPTIIYILIGNGLLKEKVIKEAINEKLLLKNIYIFDSMPKSELAQLYYECSMGSSFVINVKELWSNSANKFFDTLAAGRPILINHGGWQKDIILKENLGFILPPVLTDEKVNLFVSYSYSIETHSEQRKNSLEIAQSLYSLEMAAKKYVNIIKNINLK